MKKKTTIFRGIVIFILVAVISYFWATALMDSLYAYRSPLKDRPPKPDAVLGSSNTRAVVIVLIDALRYDTSVNYDVMPYLNELIMMGATAIMHSRPPSYSEPGYSTLLTGAWPDISDGPALNLDYANIPTFTQDDIFSAAHRAGLLTAISGFNWFEKLVPQGAVTTSFYTAGEDQTADRDVVDTALPWLREGKYNLVLIHLDQVDYAGHHEGGPIDPRWNDAAGRADTLLREITSAMDLTQDTLLVLSDHGQIDYGGHGGQDEITLTEPFVLVGKGIIPGKYADIQMVDAAPTVAALLGTNIPATSQGNPRVEMLELSLEQTDKIKDALFKQQTRLAETYGEAIKQRINIQGSSDIVDISQAAMNSARESRINNERLPRGIIGIIFIVLILNLAIWHASPYTAWILGGILIYFVLFNAKYLLIDHKTYSLSSVLSANNLIINTAITTSIAIFIGWLFVLLGSRTYREKSKSIDMTMKFILATFSILAIPIVINYVFNGATVTWTLPNFLLSFLGLLFLIQVLVIAAVGLIITGLAAIIELFARGRYVTQEGSWT